MQDEARIIITGRVAPDFDREGVAETLAKMFQVDKSESLSWLENEETIVRRGVPTDQAERHVNLLNRIGACARFETDTHQQFSPSEDLVLHQSIVDEVMPEHRAVASAKNENMSFSDNSLSLVADSPVQKPISGGNRHLTSSAWTCDMPVETETPPIIGLSMTGRIGRLRYIVYSFFGLFAYAIGIGVFAGLLGKSTLAGLMFVFLVLGVLLFWLSVRAVILRLHDIGLSGLWIFVVLGVPMGIGTFWPSTTTVDMVNFVFLVFFLILSFLPGESLKNNYGSPSGPNTIPIKLASIFSIGLLVFPFFAHHG